jgi:hypothetical protein
VVRVSVIGRSRLRSNVRRSDVGNSLENAIGSCRDWIPRVQEPLAKRCSARLGHKVRGNAVKERVIDG